MSVPAETRFTATHPHTFSDACSEGRWGQHEQKRLQFELAKGRRTDARVRSASSRLLPQTGGQTDWQAGRRVREAGLHSVKSDDKGRRPLCILKGHPDLHPQSVTEHFI